MLRRQLPLVLAVAWCAVLFGAASWLGQRAAAQGPFSFTYVWGYFIDDPVEQQSPNFFYNNCGHYPPAPACDPASWVRNPYRPPAVPDAQRCMWDVDDYEGDQALGHLSGGQSASVSRCEIANGDFNNFTGNEKEVQVQVYASSSGLSVTLVSTAGQSFTATAVPNGSGYKYVICTADLTFGPYPVIAGSNGGTGIATTWTLTVTNPTSKPIKDIDASIQMYGFMYDSVRRWHECPLYS